MFDINYFYFNINPKKVLFIFYKLEACLIGEFMNSISRKISQVIVLMMG